MRHYAITFVLPLLLLVSSLAPLTANGGTLGVYENSSSPGSFLILTPPASGVLIDVDYDAPSAEGAGLFGMSEVRFFTTGDVTFDSTGFSCVLAGCMIAPEIFTGGTEFAVTGGDDLNGDFLSSMSLITVRVSGSNGFVGVSAGEYLDATGAGASIGSLRTIDTTILARVPEPGFGSGFAVAGLWLAYCARKRRG